jgi:hypothetical protein
MSLGVGSAAGSSSRDLESELAGVLDDAVSHALAEAAEPVAEGFLVELPCRDRERGDCRPGLGVTGRLQREEVVARARAGVTPGEGLPEARDLS